MTDAPVFGGTGRPIKPVGLIASAFRPSDDATMYPYLIPSNIFAVLSLRQLEKIYRNVLMDVAFANECGDFANEVQDAINSYGVGRVQTHGRASLEPPNIYAYEVDGFGNKVFMDDANVPSLMSLGYLDPKLAKTELYQNTREFLLSDNNPWFIRGKAAEGQGSPHTGKENIWPMGIILRAMT
ncbi:MAG: metal-independent alpha-mannosidase, partial [Marinilabiliales bacterium]